MVFDPRLESAAGNDPFTQRGDDDDDGGSRDVRPGRGTEDRVVERDPSPEPSRPDRDSGPSRDVRPDRGARDEPSEPSPSPEPSPSQDRDTGMDMVERDTGPSRDVRPDRGVDRDEQPVDIDLPSLDDAAMATSEFIAEAARQPLRSPTAEAVAGATGQEIELMEEAGPRQQAIRRGAGEVLNVPATAAGLQAGVEFGAARVEQAVRGDPGGAGRETIEAGRDIGEAFVEQARERPLETGAALAGGLLVSGGAIAGARTVSPAAGRAAAFAIQPGEEIAGAAGLRATRAVAGERRAQQLFPEGEPLIFSEEAVIRRAQQVGERLPDLEVRRTERVGAGLVPPVEVGRRTRTEVETEPELEFDDTELETATLIREAERTRFEIEEGVLRPRVEFEGIRRDFGRRFETGLLEEELVEETERVRPEFAQFETPRFRSILESEAARETELRLEADLARELEQVRELEMEAFVETELRREVEAEPFRIDVPSPDEDDEFMPVELEGVRTVEAELEPREL